MPNLHVDKGEYVKEVKSLIRQIVGNSGGFIIMSTPKHEMGIGPEYVIQSPREKVKRQVDIADLDEETLYDMYDFLTVALQVPPKVVEEEKVTASEKSEEIDWLVAPEAIHTLDKTKIGEIGIIRTPEGMAVPVFVAPDETYATLSMYHVGNKNEKDTAIADMKDIGLAIITMAQKYENDEKA